MEFTCRTCTEQTIEDAEYGGFVRLDNGEFDRRDRGHPADPDYTQGADVVP